MFYLLLEHFFKDSLSLFSFVSFRGLMAAMTSILLSIFFGRHFIALISAKQFHQVMRDYNPENHLQKQGTPTMGGLLILFSLCISVVLWADIRNFYIQFLLATTIVFGTIGFLDDWLKIKKSHHSGLLSRYKFLLQTIAAFLLMLVLYWKHAGVAGGLHFYLPFLKGFFVDLGWLFVPLGFFAVVGSSNAANITDGQDGLLVGVSVCIAGVLAVYAFVSGNSFMASYLLFPYYSGFDEVAIFCVALLSACLSFLWFNSFPASIFMGDVGSLAIGALLGMIAIIIRQEIIFIVAAGVLLVEIFSVMLQVGSFKLRGKRIFLMAPLHHHFEKKGYPETKIVIRAWMINLLLAILCVVALKIR